MKFAKLIRRNLFRNKLRAIMTILLMITIFFFVATLLSILRSFETYSDSGKGYNRLVVESAISLANMLPYAYEQKLRAIPGVEDVCKLQWNGAYYKEKSDFFANFAGDQDHMATVFDDYFAKVDKKQFADFQNDRQGVIVGKPLMEKYHWKIGQRITLKRQIFPFDPELNIRATFDHPIQGHSLYFHMDYFDKSMHDIGQVATFWLKIKDPKQMAAISQQIDAMTKNSEYPTETLTEKAFQQGFLSMMGNVKLLFSSLSLCAVFMVVLLAAITMSMSARERTTEIAVLKAIGFERRLILTLMLTEFITLTLIGGALGVFAAKIVYSLVDMAEASQGFLQGLTVAWPTAAFCLAVAAGVGLLAGGLPALRAANMSVVNGLRRVV